MRIHLNGQFHELEKPTSLSGLLDSLNLAGKPVVVEINLEAVLPKNFPSTRIESGDRVEIITLAAGG